MENTPETPKKQLEVLWSPQKLADYLSLSVTTIYGWVNNGKIKYIKIGNRVRIPKSEVERIVSDAHSKLEN